MRLNLELKKGKTRINFISPVKISDGIKLNSVGIKWTFYNVGLDEKILVDSTEHSVPIGYYSFDDLKEYLESLNAVVNLEKSGKCSITPPAGKTLYLKNFGKLLGFNTNVEINSKQMSPYIIDVHGGLDKIEIFCDRINSYRNFLNGKRSEKLCQILVPGGNLFGINSVNNFDVIIPLEKGEYSFMEFTVSDHSFLSDKDSYIIFLDCVLN